MFRYDITIFNFNLLYNMQLIKIFVWFVLKLKQKKWNK